MNSNQHIRFTGIVITYNEQRHLPECLRSLAFCDQLLVIDLGSTDASIHIAKTYGAKVICHDWVPIVEEMRKEAVKYSMNDWLIFLDPDEVFPADVASELRTLISNNPKLGLINIPWQFYFKNKPLFFTIWGMEKTKGAVCHKKRNEFTSNVHRGLYLLNGFTSMNLENKPSHFIKHYWINSYSQLFKKHWRYINKEGESRYRIGERFSWRRFTKDTAVALKQNLIDYNGICGGLLGIFLSSFYSWYVAMSLLSLRRYQNLVRLQKFQNPCDVQN